MPDLNKEPKNIFKLKKLLILIFLLIFFSIFFFSYPKKIISKLIFSHDLSLLSYSVFSAINKNVDFDMTLKKNQKKSLLVLNNYVYKFLRPTRFDGGLKNLDSGVSWKMLHGSIWCDGVSDIYLRLAEYTNTRVVMVALFNQKGSSPHTINFVDLDNMYIEKSIERKKKTKLIQNKLKKMYPFDSTYNYIPIRVEPYDSLNINKKNKLNNLNYILNNRFEFPGYGIFDGKKRLSLLEYDKEITNVNRLLSEYSLINNLSLKIHKIIPEVVMKKIYQFGIFINPELDNNYKEFLYARLDHILLDYDGAKKKYSNIALDTNTYLISQYWFNRIISEESILEEYDKMKFNNFYHKNLF